MFRNFSIAARILLINAILLFTIFILTGVIYFTALNVQNTGLKETERVMLDGEKEKVKLGTETMAVALGVALKDVTDKQQRHDIIKSYIQDYRFEEDKSGYYFTYIGTVIFMHPTLPQREGEDLDNAADANGVHYVRELYKSATAGGGFVTFIFPKPPSMNQAPKLAYAMFIPGTDIWISTGIYIDNIETTTAAINAREMGKLKTRMVLILSAIGAVIAFILLPVCFLILRSITKPLRETVRLIVDISATRDLSLRANRTAKDEVGKMVIALDDMMDEIQSSVIAVGERATLMNNEVASFSQAAESVVVGSQNQTDAAGSIASSVDRMSSGINSVTNNVKDARELAISAGAVSEEGSLIIGSTTNEMNITMEIVTQTSSVIQTLGEDSRQISTVVQVIKDVADQTNLLALNAAIEAARAGDQGRGFAVVADEVRKLAERTTKSLDDIIHMVAKIQNSANEAVDEMGKVVGQVKQGQTLTREAGEKMLAIKEHANKVSSAIEEIAHALNEQSLASQDIAKNVENITQMTEQNTQAAGIASRGATRLSELSSEVQNTLNRFKVQQ